MGGSKREAGGQRQFLEEELFLQDLAVQVFSPGTPLRERARRGGAAAAGSHGVLGAVVKVTCGRLGLGWGSGRRVRGRGSEPCTEGWRRRLPGVALAEVAKAPELVSEGSQIPQIGRAHV